MSVEGIYRHFKGNYYEVIGLAVDMYSQEEFVLYRQMYGAFCYWVRPKSMFFGKRVTTNGPVTRFRKIGVSNENIMKIENIFEIPIVNTETRGIYRVISSYKSNGETVFEIKQVKDSE